MLAAKIDFGALRMGDIEEESVFNCDSEIVDRSIVGGSEA